VDNWSLASFSKDNRVIIFDPYEKNHHTECDFHSAVLLHLFYGWRQIGSSEKINKRAAGPTTVLLSAYFKKKRKGEWSMVNGQWSIVNSQ
jgi:hypothetical protein